MRVAGGSLQPPAELSPSNAALAAALFTSGVLLLLAIVLCNTRAANAEDTVNALVDPGAATVAPCRDRTACAPARGDGKRDRVGSNYLVNLSTD